MDEWRRIALEIEPEPRSDWKEVVDTVLPNIMLQLYGAQGDFKGAVSLAYIKNPLGPPILH